MGRLDCRVVAARNLPNVQSVGQIDPYCKVTLDNISHSTGVVQNSQNPEWNEVLKFQVADAASAQLLVEVWNSNVASDDFLGAYKLSLAGLIKGEVKDEWYILTQCKSNAEIHLRVLALDFGLDPIPQPQAQPLAQPECQPAPLPDAMPPPQGAYPPQPYQQQQPPAQAYPQQQWPAQPAPPPPQAAPVAAYAPPQQPQWGAPPEKPPVQGTVVCGTGNVTGPSTKGLSGFLNSVVAAANTGVDSLQNAVKNTGTGTRRHQPIYMNTVDSFVFILMDGTLRHVPDATVFTALFNRPMDAQAIGKDAKHFSTAAGAVPPPFPFGKALPPYARIVHFNNEFYLVDEDNGRAVRRHLNHGAWAQFGLTAGGNIKTINLQEFQELPQGLPLA